MGKRESIQLPASPFVATVIAPPQPAASFSGRCVQCGRKANLVALAEGFTGLGWCSPCNREHEQGTLELPGGVL